MTDRRGREPFYRKQRYLLTLGVVGLGVLFCAGCRKTAPTESVPTDPILVRVLSIPDKRDTEVRSFPLFTKEGQSARLSFRVPGQLYEPGEEGDRRGSRRPARPARLQTGGSAL